MPVCRSRWHLSRSSGPAGVFVLIGKNAGISWLANYNLYSLKGMFLIFVYYSDPDGHAFAAPGFSGDQKRMERSRFAYELQLLPFLAKDRASDHDAPSIMRFTVDLLFANALIAYTTPYLLVNNGVPLLPIKITDMFVGDVRQHPELGSALSIVMLLIMLLVLACTNLVKKFFQKGRD